MHFSTSHKNSKLSRAVNDNRNMFPWPISRWSQAGISFAAALVSAIAVYIYTFHTHFARYAAQYPHDGRDGLGAFMDALEDAAGTFILAFLITFVAQLVLTAGDLRPNDEP